MRMRTNYKESKGGNGRGLGNYPEKIHEHQKQRRLVPRCLLAQDIFYALSLSCAKFS